MKGIYKSFGANDVLRDVSFTLNGGEICALLGENGAGKSTLMNILGGVHHADQGQILLDGKRVAFQTPADSLKHGIASVSYTHLDVYKRQGRVSCVTRYNKKSKTRCCLRKVTAVPCGSCATRRARAL